MATITELKKIASQVRRDIIRQTAGASSGHPGGSPPLWYSVLARSGYFKVKELATFRKINSRLQGHPATHEGLPGIRIASGSLGQGLSVAIGTALAKKLDGDKRTVYVLTGDGELQEGQVWEAMMFAAHHKVDNLITIVDWNGQQIDGPTKKVMSLGNLEAKWKSFGWEVMKMDGHNMSEIIKTLGAAKGVDFMEGTHKWHGKATNAEQTKIALSQLEETLGDY